MKTSVVYVGMDVHKKSITFAMLIDGSEIPVIEKLPNKDEKIRKFFNKASKHGEVKTCYEASSCGYVLWRKLSKWGYGCDVIAPSLVPKSKANKIKTDKRDAIALVRLYKAGMLSLVKVPTEKHEMDRALASLRKQKSEDVKRNKHRILNF
jgi:transposase